MEALSHEELEEFEKEYDKYAVLCRCSMYNVRAAVNSIREIITKLQGKRDPFKEIREKEKKTFVSTLEKLERKKYELSMAGVESKINDVAGIRIVTLFLDDVYTIRDMLLACKGLSFVEEVDYFKNPKPNGYRSLHLVMSTDIFDGEKTKKYPVEIQIRTSSQDDIWEREWILGFKNSSDDPSVAEMFKDMADAAAEADEKALALKNLGVIPITKGVKERVTKGKKPAEKQ